MNQQKHWTETIGVNPSTLTKHDFVTALESLTCVINIHNDHLVRKGWVNATKKDKKHSDYLHEVYNAWATEYRNHKSYFERV